MPVWQPPIAGDPGRAIEMEMAGGYLEYRLVGDVPWTQICPISALTGPQGPAGVNAFGSPTSRSLSLATAYQATTTTKPAIVTINLTSSASFSLIGGATNTADIVIGSTNAVASGTGTVAGKYVNASTASVAVGVGVASINGSPCTFALPTGWYFAVRQTAGTVTITSAFDQSVG